MSVLDLKFIQTCNEILTRGASDVGLDVRPRWSDGTPAHTKMIFNVANTYYMSKDYIPILTLRKTNFRACVDEILWIYQKCSNNIKDLNSHIWDSWADENGSIGKAYGYQIGKRYRHHKYTPGEDLSDYLSAGVGAWEDWVWMNQIDAVIWSLRNNSTDRGIITNMYNHQDLADMRLRPCAYSMTFNVGHRNGRKILHGLLNQRSQDMVTANGWNVTQYAVLLQMIAQVCDMEPGTLTHMVANCHIYDRHEDIARDMIKMYCDGKYHGSPKFWINPDIRSFKDFTVDDVKLIDYKHNDYNPKIEVAV